MSDEVRIELIFEAMVRYELFTIIALTTTGGYHVLWFNTPDGSTHIVKRRA